MKPLPLFRSVAVAALLGLFLLGSISSARATVLSYEPFTGYTTGSSIDTAPIPSPTVAGYLGNWVHASTSFGTQDILSQASSLSFSGSGYPATQGGSVGVPTNTTGGEITAANSGRIARQLDTFLTATSGTTETLYLSWLFKSGQETGATSYQMLALYNGIGNTNNDAFRTFDAGLTNNGGNTGLQYDFGVNGTYTSTGITADANTHLFVVEFNLAVGTNAVTVWIDPTSPASANSTVSAAGMTWDTLTLSDYDGNSASWDEIRWGTTFNDVATTGAVPEPGALPMLLGGVSLLFVYFRNRRA